MKRGFTISEFAKLRDININSLRYYEKIGVLTPAYVDSDTGYRYYTPEQLSLLDSVLLCIDLGIPLKKLSEYMKDDEYIQNRRLLEEGKVIAQNKVRDIQTGLNRIEYTLQYLDVNRQYTDMDELYERPIIERTFITSDYTGDLMDVRKIEISSAELYSRAQKKRLSPVFPAGLIISFGGSETRVKIFFQVIGADPQDEAVMKIPAGDFLCRQIDLTPETDLMEVIRSTFDKNDEMEIIVSNMLLDKFQIGTKRSELQVAVVKNR